MGGPRLLVEFLAVHLQGKGASPLQLQLGDLAGEIGAAFGRFAVEDRVTGRLVGRVGIMRQPVWNETPEQDEVGWVIASERWGVGLATEAGHAAIADVFERIELTRVLSWTEPGNAASLRVMAKLGLARGGMVEWKGSEHVWCSLTTEAFAAHSLEEQVSD